MHRRCCRALIGIYVFGAHTQTVPADWSMTTESHHAFEILIVLDGAQETRMDHEQFIVNSDDILLIPPGFEHTNKCISATSMTYFCAHFDIDEPSLRMRIMKKTVTGSIRPPICIIAS
ncbi:AraC family ligand binding domain-containing protein [Paenibacillus rhizoplanae]